MTKYNNRDIVEIKKSYDKVDIIGFAAHKVALEIKELLNKVSQASFPKEWEDVDDLILGQSQVLVKNVMQGTLEWQNLETRFKAT
jgi:poly [ADP-ribose] polymerase 7/11/12/13